MLRLDNKLLVHLLGGAAVLLAASQLIFWVGLGFAEALARPQAGPGPAQIDMYLADEDGTRLSPGEPIVVPLMPEPAYGYQDAERHPRAWFVHYFEHQPSDPDYGIYLSWSRRVVDVRLNGEPLKTESPTDVWGILAGFEPVVYAFPREFLEPGENTIELLNASRSRKILPYFYVGDLIAIHEAHSWGRIFTVDVPLAAIGVMLFAMLLCLWIDWPARDRVRIRTLALLLGTWALRNIMFFGIDGGLPDPYRLLSHFIVTYIFLFGVLVFALGWTRRPAWTFKLAGVAFLAVCIVAGIATAIAEYTLWVWGFTMETGLTLAIGFGALLLFADFWIKNERKETVEILLFLVCIAAIVVDAVDDRWQITVPFVPDLYLTFYAAPMCGLLLALGMVASLAAQTSRARIATEDVNQLLTTRLKEQEKQLTESHEREKEVEKQQVLVDERQRIIRDMHDGVGGSMMSMLLQARRNQLSNDQLVQSLNMSLNDLRLIIDSFDHVGDNLEFALSAFRQRVEPELRARDVTLKYETSAANAISGFGPEAVLQVFRILQEACNNAVNHGNAENIDIHLSTDESDRTVRIVVRDDGTGIDRRHTNGGRGLANMQHRAERLEGQVEIERAKEPCGTRVVLTFPQRTPALP